MTCDAIRRRIAESLSVENPGVLHVDTVQGAGWGGWNVAIPQEGGEVGKVLSGEVRKEPAGMADCRVLKLRRQGIDLNRPNRWAEASGPILTVTGVAAVCREDCRASHSIPLLGWDRIAEIGAGPVRPRVIPAAPQQDGTREASHPD